MNHVRVHCMPRSEQDKFRLQSQEKAPIVVQGDPLAGVPLDEDEVSPIAQKRLKKAPWFDIVIDTLDVELSLMRWMEGKGIIKSADIKGVRGIVDNRRAGWNKDAAWDSETIRKSRIPGGLEVEKLNLEDLSIIVYMPKGFRPFPVSIIKAHLSRLRREWYGFLKKKKGIIGLKKLF
jgi:distribution and morphology protein 31